MNARPIKPRRRVPASPGRQAGITSIEYALMAGLVAIALLVAITTLGSSLVDGYSNTARSIQKASSGG